MKNHPATTPDTPWRIELGPMDNADSFPFCIVDTNGRLVADVLTSGGAALIVRAVNSYEPMQAALRGLLDPAHDCREQGEPMDQPCPLRVQAEAALALAAGTEEEGGPR